MKVTFFSDPHLGFRPKSHVTTASAKRYQEAVSEAAWNAVARKQGHLICLGDLFHHHSNKEAVIQEGAAILRECYLSLNGNHDALNVAGSVSSFDLAFEMTDSTVTAFTHKKGNYASAFPFWTCCHYFTQEDFEQAVRSACEDAAPVEGYKYLLLHCNVGEGHGQEVEKDGHSLYLTEELQDLVSKTFTRVFVGHEHVARTCKGNIHIVGNTIPLSFGEMADRYVWHLDTETNKLEKETILSINERFEQISYQAAVLPSRWWIEVVGSHPVEKRAEINQWIAGMWKEHPHLLSIKNSVEFTGASPLKEKRESFIDLRSAVLSAARDAGFEKELEELA